MKLIIKTIPPTINKYIGRTNHREYQKDKKEISESIRLQTIGINPRYKQCKLKVTYYFKDKRRHDPGNYDKMLLDGLVDSSIIEDDNYDVIKEYTTIGSYDKDNPRVEIEIEEVK